MKLVELAVKNFKEFPSGESFIWQDYDGTVWGYKAGDEICRWDDVCDYPRKFGQNLPDDSDHIQCEVVTRAQWEAERARIAKTEQILSVIEQGNKDAESLKDAIDSMDAVKHKLDTSFQKRYEQELWDKVALKTLAAQIQNQQSIGADVGWCADVADAFMAERAKRLKGVK